MAIPRRRIVGIDLGTTNTVVAWAEPHARSRIELFPIPQWVTRRETQARSMLPSLLYAPLAAEVPADPWNDSPWVIGELARMRGQEVPGRLVSSAKSWLCHAAVDRMADILPWGGQPDADVPRVSPLEASARILLHVRTAWDQAYPQYPLADQQVVLTVPASFDQGARELTIAAAHRAGLTVRLLEEPQAAFYSYMHDEGLEPLRAVVGKRGEALILVCDIGGGTTDLTLIRAFEQANGALDISRVAVGRHLLLGGDNMDLALAHACEQRMTANGSRLDPARFGQLVLACKEAKEKLLGDAPPEDVPVTVLATGAALVGSTLSTRLGRIEAESLVLDGFFPEAPREARPARARSALVAFGLPYEPDPAITRHVAAFFARYAQVPGPDALLLNGGLFRAQGVSRRLTQVMTSWGGPPPALLPHTDPDLAVARGAVAYGLALAGHGLLIGGGAPHGYYVGLREAGSRTIRRALCVVPRGAQEGERYVASSTPLALRVGGPVRFELFASDAPVARVPGQVVGLDEDQFERLPPVAMTFDVPGAQPDQEVPVALEGELSAIGTLELACVEQNVAPPAKPRRFRLAFELREAVTEEPSEPEPGAGRVRTAGPGASRMQEAAAAIDRVFGKGRKDVKSREVKDLLRELERLLGERGTWRGELARELFDLIGPQYRARRRSPDHERMYWMLAGYCLRPGYGHPLDPQRVAMMEPLFVEGLAFPQETRNWQHFWIAWRRIAGGLSQDAQNTIRSVVDPFLAPPEHKLKKPKGFRPQAMGEMLEMASSLEKLPVERRTALGTWILERTWTDRDPRLWAAIGRLGARVPAYASVHHVIPARTAERWLEQLLREKWADLPSAPHAAAQLARRTGDRARDVSAQLRDQVVQRLQQAGAKPEWVQAVQEVVAMADAERAEFFGEELPLGLRLVED